MRKRVTETDMSDVGILRFMVNVLYDGEHGELTDCLLERFGSLSGVLCATREELLAVKDMTERAASFFTVMLPVVRQALLREVDGKLNSEAAAARFALAYFMTERLPADVCICADKNNNSIAVERLERAASLRDVISCVCRNGAQKLLLLHYIPYGAERKQRIDPERVAAVRSLTVPLEALGIELVDYVEYTPFMLYSLRRAATDVDAPITVDMASEEEYRAFDLTTLFDEYIKKAAV